MLKIKLLIITYAVILISGIVMFLKNTGTHQIKEGEEVYEMLFHNALDYNNSFESQAFSEMAPGNRYGIITVTDIFIAIALIVFLVKILASLTSWSSFASVLVSISITCISFLVFFNICSFIGYENMMSNAVFLTILAFSNIIMFISEGINRDESDGGIFNVRESFEDILDNYESFDNQITQFKLNHQKLLS